MQTPCHAGPALLCCQAPSMMPLPLLQVPGIDSVSYGPTIRGAHSPDERVQISTVQPFYDATLKILEALAEKRA